MVFSQSQGQGWERGSGGVAVDPGMRGREGYKGIFPYPSWDGSEGGEEAVHIATGVTYVTIIGASDAVQFSSISFIFKSYCGPNP